MRERERKRERERERERVMGTNKRWRHQCRAEVKSLVMYHVGHCSYL